MDKQFCDVCPVLLIWWYGGDELDRPHDPRAPAYAVYHYLGWLEDQVVAGLAEGIDPAGTAD